MQITTNMALPIHKNFIIFRDLSLVAVFPLLDFIRLCFVLRTKIVQIESKSKSKLVLKFTFAEMQPILRVAKSNAK